MYHKSNKKSNLAKLIAIYSVMTLSVIVLVTFITLFVLGYRIDSTNGQLEHYALLQFSSVPSGATVTVNGKKLSSQTPNKSAVKAGNYSVTISKAKYQPWTKTIDIKAGTLQWLNYALLVPVDIAVETVAPYDSLSSSLASPDGHYMLVQKQSSVPTFSLADLSSDTVKFSDITIPTGAYSEAATVGVVHTFTPVEWDKGGRHILVKHNYSDKFEWIVFDTQDINSSKNITKTFDFAIESIDFSGESGNVFYALGSGDVRKLDLSAGTISRSLISGVSSFDVYGPNILTYVGVMSADTKQQVVGFYRDGDDKSYVLKTIINTDNLPVHIATTRYFNEDYVAISYGKVFDIIKGTYPNSSIGDVSSLKPFTEQSVNFNISNLSFSPSGQYLLMQNGSDFSSYDVEYKGLTSSKIDGDGVASKLNWLDDNYVVSDSFGNLTIREFDGANMHTINPVISNQGITLADNGRYLYSFNKTETGYRLQRVRMILP